VLIEKETIMNKTMNKTMELKAAIESGKVISGTELHSEITGRTTKTMRSIDIPMVLVSSMSSEEKPVIAMMKVPEGALLRAIGVETYQRDAKVYKAFLNDGTEIDLDVERFGYRLKRTESGAEPIMYIKYVMKPKNPYNETQSLGHEMSLRIIENGLKIGSGTFQELMTDELYEGGPKSQAAAREGRGVLVNTKLKIDPTWLEEKFQGKDKKYSSMLAGLRGRRAAYMVSSNGWWAAIEGTDQCPSNVEARCGLTLSASLEIPGDWKVKRTGSVRISFSDTVKASIRSWYTDGKMSLARVEQTLKVFEEYWKEEKCDGQNIIVAEEITEGLNAKFGTNYTVEQVTGLCFQARVLSGKGLFIALKRDWLWNLKYPDGSYAYRGYNIIIDNESWKYDPDPRFPTLFNMTGCSKEELSRSINMQLMNALDLSTRETMKELADGTFNAIKDSMLNAPLAKALTGTTVYDDIVDDLKIDGYRGTLRSLRIKALDAGEAMGIVEDPYFRKGLLGMFSKKVDGVAQGRILVQGAVRYLITDITAMLQTRLAQKRVDKDGNAVCDMYGTQLWDIIITDPSQLALGGGNVGYWKGNKCKAVQFRNPCIHPSEPQLLDLKALDEIPEDLDGIPAREIYSYLKYVTVLGACNEMLDCLGGADCDGDTGLICIQDKVVAMVSRNRVPLLCKIPSKKMTAVISLKSMDAYSKFILRDNEIGTLTNSGTVWRDIESNVQHALDPKKVVLPSAVIKALKDAGKFARKILSANEATMDEYEKSAINAIIPLELLWDRYDNPVNPDWQMILILACEAALKVIRRLQEAAISTAKTGVFIETARYKYVMLKIRPTWFRTTYDPKLNYNSNGMMAFVHSYTKTKWDELNEWANTTSSVMQIPVKDISHHQKLYNKILSIKAEYGVEQFRLEKKWGWVPEGMDRDTAEQLRDSEREMICTHFHNKLRVLAMEEGSIDTVSSLVYYAGNEGLRAGQRSKSKGHVKEKIYTGSFAWRCWGEELIATMKHVAAGQSHSKVIPISLSSEFRGCLLTPKWYRVTGRKLTDAAGGEVVFGKVNVDDGIYELANLNEKNYLLKSFDYEGEEEAVADLSSVGFRVIGFKHYGMTREDVVKLLNANDGAVTTISNKREDGMHVVHVKVGDICIGNIPAVSSDADIMTSMLLKDKTFKAAVAKHADKHDSPQRISLVVLAMA
jgi:hypothetical protein